MYKIMLADDEGIVTDSLKFMIERGFGGSCAIEAVKTGRAAIELAESYRPDIVFMDIQMPGLNGIEAMKEIQKRNNQTVFIVLSAYDKFNYAKQAIDLGVLEYLMKPVGSAKVTEVLKKAMTMIDDKRKKISDDLAIREKLRTVVPVLENSFIYTLLFQEQKTEEIKNYRALLSLEEAYGYIMILEYGDDAKEGVMTNPVGASVKIQKVYEELRETVKEFWQAIIGAPMANRIVMYIPSEKRELDYNARIQMIENARVLTRMMSKQFYLKFTIGIGGIYSTEEAAISYKEAMEALRNRKGSVTHIQDVPVGCNYEADYPIRVEQKLFDAVQKGKVGEAQNQASGFFQWMLQKEDASEDSLRLKVIEFVLWAEHLAYESGGMTYHFLDRNNYLAAVTSCNDNRELENWFVDKIGNAARNISKKQEKQASSLVSQASAYIESNFSKEITLDEVSREVNISPYYFSKLFKEEKGVNFVEYLTQIRIEYAKSLLVKPSYSVKEVCLESGYSDPNYFSRIFKKYTGCTPSEFREGGAMYEPS